MGDDYHHTGSSGVYTVEAMTAPCAAGALATAGAIGSAAKSPTWDNVEKAAGGVGGLIATGCAKNIGAAVGSAGAINSTSGTGGMILPMPRGMYLADTYFD